MALPRLVGVFVELLELLASGVVELLDCVSVLCVPVIEQVPGDLLGAGAKGYVVKDIERFTLKESIRAVHSGGGAVSPAVASKVLDRLRSHQQAPTPERQMPLSDTQLEIVRLIANGLSNREIAEHVHLSENTVKSHVQEIFRKLDVGNRVEAALRASREGWL